MIEYAFLLFVITIALVILLSVIGVDVMEMFDAVENQTGSDEAAGDEGVNPAGNDDAGVDEARQRPE